MNDSSKIIEKGKVITTCSVVEQLHQKSQSTQLYNLRAQQEFSEVVRALCRLGWPSWYDTHPRIPIQLGEWSQVRIRPKFESEAGGRPAIYPDLDAESQEAAQGEEGSH